MNKVKALKNSDDLCWNCLKRNKDITVIKITELGYGSYFDGCSTEIHLCKECYEKSKDLWKLDIITDENGFEMYSNEEKMFDFIDKMPLEGRQFVRNEFESGWNSRPMEPQDWIDYELGILSYEKCKDYGLYAPEEINAYRERFPKCGYPALRVFSDGSKSTWCPFGAYGASGTENQEAGINISDECYQCTHYKERMKPIQICDENADSDSWEKYKMRCLLGDIEV